MALSRGMTALRAALGAVGGGLEGYAQFQEMTRRQEFEREKEKAAAARQAMYDALALADRGALPTAQSQALGQRAVGEVGKAALNAFNVASGGPAIGFDSSAIAQGAGRMGAPAAKFTVGGVEYALPDQEQRRRALAAQEAAARRGEREADERDEENRRIREEQRGAQRIRDLSTAAKKGGRRSEAAIELAAVNQAAYRALFPEPDQLTPLQQAAQGKEMDRAEARWNSLVNTPENQLTPEEQQFRSTMVRTFDRLRNRDPRTGAVRGKTEPARSLILQAVSAAEEQEALRRQNRQKNDLGYLGIGAGVTPAVAPTLEQAVGRSTAQPTSMDAEAMRYQRWNEIKAQNPSMSDDEVTAQVRREIP